jgi:hypothetical protein
MRFIERFKRLLRDGTVLLPAADRDGPGQGCGELARDRPEPRHEP